MIFSKKKVLFLFTIILSTIAIIRLKQKGFKLLPRHLAIFLFLGGVLTLSISLAKADNSNEVLLNEVYVNGTSEWIEIYNPLLRKINLSGYKIIGSATTSTKYIKTDNTIEIEAGTYIVIDDSKLEAGALAFTDTGGTISLSNPDGNIINSVTYGNGTSLNADQENKSLQLINGVWQIENITPGQINISSNNSNNQNTDPPADQNSNIQNPTSNSGGGSSYCQATKGDVLINEFLSSPTEDEEEWVELISNCSQTISLAGWTLEDGTGTKTELSGTFEKYFVIDAPKGKLNNAGDLIILKNSNGQIIDEIVYGTWQTQSGPRAPGSGQSLVRDTNTHEFVLSVKPTKGSINIIEVQEETNTTTKTTATSSPIIISEIFPNPPGVDSEGEFIELFNQSPQTIALKDWQLTNEVGQVFIFTTQSIAPTTSVAFFKTTTGLSLKNDHDTIKLYAPGAKTASQSVGYKNAVEGQSYIYDVSSKAWQWSLASTPNKTNFLIKPNTEPTAIFYARESANINETVFLDGSDSFDPFSSPLNFLWDFGDQASSTLNAVEHAWTKAGNFTIKLTVNDGELSNTKEFKIKIIDPRAKPELTIAPNPIAKQVAPQTTANNSLLKINAIVVTPPGLFGAQWFYVMPLDDGGKATNAVIQVYNNKKEFPALKIGDLIEAQGELYAIKDDTRFKTKTLEDITVLDHDNILVEKTVDLTEINKNLANELVTVSGRLSKQQGNNIILMENNKELLVELKTNTKLRAKDFTPGASYQITGLLKQAGDQIKLWPRYSDDIILLDSAQVLGEKIESSSTAPTATINFVGSKSKEKTLEYLLITALGLIIGLSVLLFKFKKAPTE